VLSASPFDASMLNALLDAALWRELRGRQPALAARLLFVTGGALSPLSRDVLAGTHCPVLDKPFTKADLVGALRQLLQG
jgi:hypothetical protein